MQLTPSQIASYQRDGFVLLPDWLTEDEARLIRTEAAAAMAQDSPARVMEASGGAVRAIHGCHLEHRFFADLSRLPRLLEPARQLLEGDVYVYQMKINTKAAFVGDVWEWHQDFTFWRNEDALPECRILSVAVFLDDVNEFNGPMLFIPGSHRGGDISVQAQQHKHAAYQDAPDWISNLTVGLKYGLDQPGVAKLVQRGGMVAPKGPSGSVLIFDGDVVHASGSNMSPFDRFVAVLTYNRTDNLPALPPRRPEFLVSRDATPLSPLEEDRLVRV